MTQRVPQLDLVKLSDDVIRTVGIKYKHYITFLHFILIQAARPIKHKHSNTQNTQNNKTKATTTNELKCLKCTFGLQP